MDKYLLKFIKDCKSKSIPVALHVEFKVKKVITKLDRKYFGTTYAITDKKHQIRIFVTNDSEDPRGCIFMDRADCFDKLATCPIQLPAPKNDNEYIHLLAYIHKILIDDAWYTISNEYQTDKWITGY